MSGCSYEWSELDHNGSIDPLMPEKLSAQLALEGVDSAYIGKSGSWDGLARQGNGQDRAALLDEERAMGLTWTFMTLYWSALEPGGPVTQEAIDEGAWASVDRFMVQARERHLNVVLQVTIGGNAGGPPGWAGRRREGSSAPEDMDALIALVQKLARRYKPGGTLALERGWGDAFGVRVWELDNEPGSYLTSWAQTSGDYVEFVARAREALRAEDERAMIVAPAMAAGDLHWLEEVLDASQGSSSAAYVASGRRDALGPHVDAVSFHNYEQLDRLFAGEPVPIERLAGEVRRLVEEYATDPEFGYEPPVHYWHTEGGYDYLGFASDTKRSRWMLQFFARAFHVGLSKVTIQDAQGFPLQQEAVRLMTQLLPWPFPMEHLNQELLVDPDEAKIYRVKREDGTHVYIMWATNGRWRRAKFSLPVRSDRPMLKGVGRDDEILAVQAGEVELELSASSPFSPVFFLVDPVP